jgi:hypothetical protein
VKSVIPATAMLLPLIAVTAQEARTGETKKQPAILSVKPDAEDPKDDELQKLIRARYNAALLEVQTVRGLFMGGKATFDTVADAGRRLLQAGLEFHRTPEARGELLTNYVELMREYENGIEQKANGGAESVQALHKARFERLNAEIQLLRFKRATAAGRASPGEDPFGVPRRK